MKKIMISVAPVAATDILINPRAIARDVYECYKNGASMVHLHCRDLNGNLTPDLSLLEETVAYIREMCDIVVEISTGGVSNLTIEERVQPCYPSWVEANSLNVGSVNLGTSVYQNPIKDVEYCVKTIMDNKKIPETEVFELGMINTVRELNDKFHFVKPILFALVFGHGGEMPATVPALRHMIQALEENFPNGDYLWGYTQAHREDWEMVKTALDMGASTVRIGFEDSDMIAPGVHVDNNAALIAKVSDIVKRAGVSRVTFYHYYETKEDALTDFFHEIVAGYIRECREEQGGRFHDRSSIIHALKYFDRYSVFILKLVDAKLLYIIQDAMNDYMMKRIMPHYKIPVYELYFYGGALLNVFIQWEKNGKREPAEMIADQITSYCSLRSQ